MKPTLVDTHAHLDLAPFDRDRSEVIARARAAGVSMIISAGIDMESSQKAIGLAEKYSEVLATVGFHPHEATRMRKADVAKLGDLASCSRVVAIGEIGLDFYRNRSPQEAQLQALVWQLELALEQSLPVVIHCRQAEEEMLPLLGDWTSSRKRRNKSPIGVIHCYSSNVETAQRYLDMGFYLSFGAYVGYPSSSSPLHNVIRSIPEDRLVVETDSPSLPPQSHRGRRNEPAYLPLTVGVLAEIKGIPPDTLAQKLTRNSLCLFGLLNSE